MANPILNDKHLEQGCARPGLGGARPRPLGAHRSPTARSAPGLEGDDGRRHDQRHRRAAGRSCSPRRSSAGRPVPTTDGEVTRLPGAGHRRRARRLRLRDRDVLPADVGQVPRHRSTPSARASSSASSPRRTRTTRTASSLQAVGATLGVFAVMLVLYRTKIIKVTDRFRRIVITATMGLMVFYLVSFVINLFGGDVSVPQSTSLLSIGFSSSPPAWPR